MTNNRMNSLLLAGALLAVGHSANATQPPDSVQSDVWNNTAMGTAALISIVDGQGLSNTAAGFASLNYDSSGSANAAFGIKALGDNTTGSYNTAVGSYALSSNSTGFNNTGTGYEALFDNTIGFNNTANGYEALFSNVSGSTNVGVGFQAMSAIPSAQIILPSARRRFTPTPVGTSIPR